VGYARPTDLTEALGLLASAPRTVLAGGTDLYPATEAPCLCGDILDIGALPGLAGIVRDGAGWSLGAAATWSRIATADLPPAFRALQQAAREVGGVQIQNAGTLGGNLCNASPAADGVPALLVLAAEVVLDSARGRRTLPLTAFLTGPRRTARRPDELLTAVRVPAESARGRSRFLKLGARTHLVISIAMVAARLDVRDGHIARAALSVGACSAVARRLPSVEAALTGAPADDALAGRIDADRVAAALDPIDDVRASAAYRARAATDLLRRAVRDCLGDGEGP